MNLDQITDEDLTYRDGCDIMFERVDATTFKGGTTTCECAMLTGKVNKLTLKMIFC